MNDLQKWLSEGDLRDDGVADEVVKIVLKNPELIDDLIHGLSSGDDVIRGHTADAVEKVARQFPDLFLPYISRFIKSARTDPVPMVRWHLAMLFGHLAGFEERASELVSTLLALLQDESAFVVSWAMVSLCIFGRKYPHFRETIFEQIKQFENDERAAIRSKVSKALPLLINEEAPFPKGWVKNTASVL